MQLGPGVRTGVRRTVVLQAAALCSQVRDLDATCDSDPSLQDPVCRCPPTRDRGDPGRIRKDPEVRFLSHRGAR